jgi:hypothetical protein
MGDYWFTKIAKQAVIDYFNSHSDGKTITASEVYIVWMCKTLQNNKALLSTNVPDGMYYEFTWNGDKSEGYLDAYKKCANIVVK